MNRILFGYFLDGFQTAKNPKPIDAASFERGVVIEKSRNLKLLELARSTDFQILDKKVSHVARAIHQ